MIKAAAFHVGQVIRLGPFCHPPTQHKFWKVKYRKYFTENPGISVAYSTTFPQWAYILETGGARDNGTGWYPENALMEQTSREKNGPTLVVLEGGVQAKEKHEKIKREIAGKN